MSHQQLHSPHDEPPGHNPPPNERLVTIRDLNAMERRLTKLIKETMPASQMAAIEQATKTLRISGAALKQAIDNVGAKGAQAGPPKLEPPADREREKRMANKTIEDLIAQVEATKTVNASAVTLINGIADRIQAAVNAALEGGATAADLAPVQAEIDSLKASTDELSAAVIANTPAAP